VKSDDVRVLGPADLSDFLELCALDPVVNVFADYRARTTQLDPRWLGGEVWGRYAGRQLIAACHVAANLVPVQCRPEDAAVFAARASANRRTASTIVGPVAAVDAFWEEAARDGWEPPREIRASQPHLEISSAPLVEPDPLVRPSKRSDIDALYPACVAMYTEEVGVSPEYGGGSDLYKARVNQLIGRRWSFARYEEGRVIFKAEVACASPNAAQIQGVYVVPERRGEGLGTSGMAAVVAHVRANVAPIVSLYVNEWNAAARAAYERVGFTETARFTTIMF